MHVNAILYALKRESRHSITGTTPLAYQQGIECSMQYASIPRTLHGYALNTRTFCRMLFLQTGQEAAVLGLVRS